MPDTSIWNQFPIVAVVVLALAFVGGGFYAFARWVWSEYCKERDKDRTWRVEQNKARAEATEIQNTAWQTTVKEMAARWEQQDKEREGTLKAIADATAKMLDKLDRHDERAQRIEAKVDVQSRRRT